MAILLSYMEKNYPWLTFESVFSVIFYSILIAIIAKQLWSKRKIYYSSLKLPGPISLPFLGSIPLIKRFWNKENPIDVINGLCEEYPSPFQLWLGSHYFVVLTDPEDIDYFYSDNYMPLKPELYHLLSEGFGNGLLTGRGGETWKRHRLLLNPAFSSPTRKLLEPVLNKHCFKLIDQLSHFSNSIINSEIIFKRFYADLVSEYLLNDADAKFSNGNLDEVLNGISNVFTSTYNRVKCAPCPLKFACRKSQSNEEINKHRTQFYKYFLGLYNRKKEEYWQNKKNMSTTNPILDSFPNPMQILIKAQNDRGYSEEEIIDEITNLFVSGVEFSYLTLNFFILMVGIHKQHQQKIYDEINDQFMIENSNEVKVENLHKFTYLDQCLKEVFRLFPISPFIFKVASEEVTLSNKNLTIPEGSIIGIPTCFNNRNGKYWKNSDSFNPDRFSPENSDQISSIQFQPFSCGPRMCIGQHIAPDMIKIAIIHLMRKFEFESEISMKNIELQYNVNLKPVQGFKTKILKR